MCGVSVGVSLSLQEDGPGILLVDGDLPSLLVRTIVSAIATPRALRSFLGAEGAALPTAETPDKTLVGLAQAEIAGATHATGRKALGVSETDNDADGDGDVFSASMLCGGAVSAVWAAGRRITQLPKRLRMARLEANSDGSTAS